MENLIVMGFSTGQQRPVVCPERRCRQAFFVEEVCLSGALINPAVALASGVG
jgi:hypothetical protein